MRKEMQRELEAGVDRRLGGREEALVLEVLMAGESACGDGGPAGPRFGFRHRDRLAAPVGQDGHQQAPLYIPLKSFLALDSAS